MGHSHGGTIAVRRVIGVLLVVACLTALAVLAGVAAGCGAGAPAPRPGPGCGQPDRSGTCGVLFIGNSYTDVNDLPAMFAQLAASAGQHVETEALTQGGATLAAHVAAPETRSTLHRSTWNVVVVQEQSQIPADPRERETEMYPAARALVSEIREARAQPLFFLTWAHADGWPEIGLPGYAAMQQAIEAGYLAIGRELNVPTAPVGAAWSRAIRRRSGALWSSDGSHPTVSGTYLAACVVFASIFHRSPEGLSFRSGLPAGTATELQAVAAKAVFTNPWQWGLA